MPRIHLYVVWNFPLTLCMILTDIPNLGPHLPRRILNGETISYTLQYPARQNPTVLFLQETERVLYVGNADVMLKIDVDNKTVIQRFPWNPSNNKECPQGPCKNVITVIQEFQGSLLVCGTNGYKPQCWRLQAGNGSNDIVESFDGTGISPYDYTQNCLSLTVEGDLYAAAPLDSDGSSLQFRRKAGSRTNVWMYDKWMLEPTFVAASWVKRKQDPENEKIYIFFREKNSDKSPGADPLITRVARVCKVDEGGSKRFFQNTWTSFLKARLVCGFPKKSLFFNHLLDVYVLHAENWRDSRVYALFASSWNSTAVCVYSMAEIDELFEKSAFKGYKGDIPHPRPGTCVPNSQSLPYATLNVVKDHSEMSEWIHSSIHQLAPLYVSNYNYTKLAVDQVQAADLRTYNVLLLATDTGKIHKCLELGSDIFIISETLLSKRSPVQSMILASKKKKLIVGFAEEVLSLDLVQCQEYNSSCAECVLSRDPYCTWTQNRCTSTVMGGIQNVSEQTTGVCSTALEEPDRVNHSKRETTPEVSTVVHTVPLGVPFYLTCPISSYHATYKWLHHGHSSPCQQMGSHCLHLIPAMVHESYGYHKCISQELNHTTLVTEYQLARQSMTNNNGRVIPTPTNSFDNRNGVAALALHIEWAAINAVTALIVARL